MLLLQGDQTSRTMIGEPGLTEKLKDQKTLQSITLCFLIIVIILLCYYHLHLLMVKNNLLKLISLGGDKEKIKRRFQSREEKNWHAYATVY